MPSILDHIDFSNAQTFEQTLRDKIQTAKTLLGSIKELRSPRTVENTLGSYNQICVALDACGAVASLFGAVHPNKDFQDAAEAVERELSAFSTELALDPELYQAISTVDVSGADAVTRRFWDKTIKDFKRSGVDRDEETRKRIKEITAEIVAIGQDFDRNIIEDIRHIELTGPEELDGLPDDYRAAHKPDEKGVIRISTRYPDAVPFMMYARSARAREALARASKNRAYPKNKDVLVTLLKKRSELAKILGHATWAHHVMEDKMIKSPDKAQNFIDQIASIAKMISEKEYKDLLAEKKKEDPQATHVADWERSYLEERLKISRFALDSKEVREYFDFSKVKEGLLTLTEELFSLKYVPAPKEKLWHAAVDSYDVLDSRDNRHLGRIYLDLHPRDGKYQHAAQFTLRSGLQNKQYPEGALVCNFPDPANSEGGLALMEHGDVVTFFHEFGHLLHHILGGHQSWIRFSGVATEWDFVEVPSQFFEAWAYEYDVLKRFAIHHKTKQPISSELVAKLKAADEFGKGLQAKHQMFYAALSLAVHTLDPQQLDLDELMDELQSRYSNFPRQNDTHFYASFGHLNGYSSNYYTYMWSEVIAKDLLSVFKEKGMMNRGLALKYREKILEPGGSKDAAQLVYDFLDRPYSFDAFSQWLEA